jgi:hypothetical protein
MHCTVSISIISLLCYLTLSSGVSFDLLLYKVVSNSIASVNESGQTTKRREAIVQLDSNLRGLELKHRLLKIHFINKKNEDMKPDR